MVPSVEYSSHYAFIYILYVIWKHLIVIKIVLKLMALHSLYFKHHMTSIISPHQLCLWWKQTQSRFAKTTAKPRQALHCFTAK